MHLRTTNINRQIAKLAPTLPDYALFSALPRQHSSSRRTRTCLQMDTHPVSLPANAYFLQRSDLPQCPSTPRLTIVQTHRGCERNRLTDWLRA